MIVIVLIRNFQLIRFRIRWWIMAWKMCRFVRGKQSMNEADRHLELAQRMHYRQVFYGYLIMLFRDAPLVKLNFGWAGENIIAGMDAQFRFKIIYFVCFAINLIN